MKIISNASPLIFLAKIGKLDLLENYEIIIGKEDAYKIENLIIKNLITVKETEIIKEIEKQNLGEGEKAAISLGIQEKIKLILLDERKARSMARFYKLKPRGTIGILIEAHKNKKISKEGLKESIQKLIKEGYRISEDIIINLYNSFFH